MQKINERQQMTKTVEVPDDIHHRVKILAATMRTTVRELVEQALQEFINNSEKPEDRN